MKVTIDLANVLQYYLCDSKSTINNFGQDYLDSYGIEVPDEIVQEYKEIMEKFKEMQVKLVKYYDLKN